ncbi:MAG: ribosome biogenesis GTP-binding protein YihA/YsxC [bacterium]|nr:ribosome biogenesis GTP-binding protein YihA/YsxC [bacterium]
MNQNLVRPFQAEFFTSVPSVKEKPFLPGWKEIVFAGRSNVGKSSLLNALCGRENLARTSKTPGSTRTINFYAINNEQLFFVDLPGYGYAYASRIEQMSWAIELEDYFEYSTNIAGVLVLVDSFVGPTDLDIQLIEWLSIKRKRFAIILTKSDVPNQSEFYQTMQKINQLQVQVPILVISVRKKKNVDKVIQLIREWGFNE